MSELIFLLCSESTALSSRSVQEAVKRGETKNWENRSRAGLRLGGETSKLMGNQERYGAERQMPG
jgi:hypothetical protein